MILLYKWRKKHDKMISPPVDYRFITYDKKNAIHSVVLESKYPGKEWKVEEFFEGYTVVLNILRLIENATGKYFDL